MAEALSSSMLCGKCDETVIARDSFLVVDRFSGAYAAGALIFYCLPPPQEPYNQS
jgi:hypothetical protein